MKKKLDQYDYGPNTLIGEGGFANVYYAKDYMKILSRYSKILKLYFKIMSHSEVSISKIN
jgi:hypothetical protein